MRGIGAIVIRVCAGAPTGNALKNSHAIHAIFMVIEPRTTRVQYLLLARTNV
jgi:hypothetical protein